MIVTVESIHPRIVIGLVDSLQPWRADNVGDVARDEWGRDAEDIAALPVEEQAAILLAICASTDRVVIAEAAAHLDVPMAYLAYPLALSTYACTFDGGDYGPDQLRLAEAEARLRNGEVRP